MNSPIICIYGIKDKRTDKIIYIGQTKNYDMRRCDHFRKTVTPIDKFMFEHDRNNFEMFPIEIFEEMPKNIFEKEQFYIDKYKTIEHGLNIVPAKGLSRSKNYRYDYIRQPEWREKWNAYMREYRIKKKNFKELTINFGR